jgi:hypothetical protein
MTIAGVVRARGERRHLSVCKTIESALENISGSVLIDHRLALGAARIGGDERALYGRS